MTKRLASQFTIVMPMIVALALACFGERGYALDTTPAPNMVKVNDGDEPVHPGKFAPTWDSLKQYQTPEWFRDAKFGIWAHWGPQCEPEDGDWYARAMYQKGSGQYKSTG